MRNPWKLTTLLFAGLFAASIARGAGADVKNPRQAALEYLTAAAASLNDIAGDPPKKTANPDPYDTGKPTGPAKSTTNHRYKAIQLIDAAIVQVKQSIKAGD